MIDFLVTLFVGWLLGYLSDFNGNLIIGYKSNLKIKV